MIVNLTGFPIARESVLASRFVLEHPEFTYCDFNAYEEKYQNREQAWSKFFKDIVDHRDVIVDYHDHDWIYNGLLLTPVLINRNTLTLDITVGPRKKSIDERYWLFTKRILERRAKLNSNKHQQRRNRCQESVILEYGP